MIHQSALIDRRAEIDEDVEIGPFVVIEGPVRIGAGCRIMQSALLRGDVRLGNGCLVYPFAVIGTDPQDVSFDRSTPSGVRIGSRAVLREGVTIHRATRPEMATEVGDDVFLMANAHVAHDCRVGSRVTMANSCLLAGFVEVGDRAFLSGNVAVHQFVRVGMLAMVGANSFLNRDVPPFFTAHRAPAVVAGLNVVGLRRAGYDQARRTRIAGWFRLLYRSGLTPALATEHLSASGDPDAIMLSNSWRGHGGVLRRIRCGSGAMPIFLGIDYGSARVGLAQSDPLGIIATPVAVLDIREKGDPVLLDWLAERLRMLEIGAFVLGYPDRDDARAMLVCDRIDALAAVLKERFGLPVHFQDEQFSTRRAKENLAASGRRRKAAGRETGLDAAAASVILQDYLDRQ